MKKSMRPLLVLLALLPLGAAEPVAPSVAVWDPGVGCIAERFTIDTAWLDRVAGWIAAAGLPTCRLTTAEIAAGPAPARIPVLVMPGDTVPRGAIPALMAYAESGGVLVALAARLPFTTAIAPAGAAGWAVDPPAPKFAWEVPTLREALGIRYLYQPALHDQGLAHTPTPLLLRYLPGAQPVRRRLPHSWLCGMPDGAGSTGFHPLMDSRRVDGQAVIPAMYVARFGRRTAVVATQPEWTGAAPQQPWWPQCEGTVQALARLALDLAAGTVALDPADAIHLAPTQAAPEPLLGRPAGTGVDPDGAEPVARFGRFDGTGWELGPPAAAPGRTVLAAGVPLPRRLDPGAEVEAPLPELGAGPLFLRVRLAFCASDAALAVAVGGRGILAEQFIAHDLQGASNHSVETARQAVEIGRIAFIPPGAAGTLVLGNPGREPVWLDALQIERRPRPAPPVLVGFNTGMGLSFPDRACALPAGAGRGWGAFRADARLRLVGPPGDPGRWALLDRQVERAVALGAPLHLLLSECPPWMASEDSRRVSLARKRPHIAVPRLELWTAMLEELVPRYRDRVAAWEVGNEVDIAQFWIGTPAQYAELWRATWPLLQRLDPGKPVFTAGLASQGEAVVEALDEAGALRQATWIANHCYAAQTPMWERGNGRLEGMLYNRGVATPIHANEQGFPWCNAEWFSGPPDWTPQRQAAAVDIGLARLMAAGHVRVSVFHAGGDDHPYGCIDAAGVPRPAYRVVEDYLALGGPDARRLDAGMVAADGGLLRGIYVAASSRGDGTATLVVNPCESPTAARAVLLRVPLPAAGAWRAVADGAPLPCQVLAGPGPAWAEIGLTVARRSVVSLLPPP
ncbi:MAG: hypothetical protein L6R48_05380 [Planctomycetes bacterium]|nr:hypothetical protein [Planctomycetota bacterium]